MECERPDGLALTGHDDHFDRIELMARSPSGGIVERTFVQINHVYVDLNARYPKTTGPLQEILTGTGIVRGSDLTGTIGQDSDADARRCLKRRLIDG
jgi:hypothetical protein